jgi:hypothetical protein
VLAVKIREAEIRNLERTEFSFLTRNTACVTFEPQDIFRFQIPVTSVFLHLLVRREAVDVVSVHAAVVDLLKRSRKAKNLDGHPPSDCGISGFVRHLWVACFPKILQVATIRPRQDQVKVTPIFIRCQQSNQVHVLLRIQTSEGSHFVLLHCHTILFPVRLILQLFNCETRVGVGVLRMISMMSTQLELSQLTMSGSGV